MNIETDININFYDMDLIKKRAQNRMLAVEATEKIIMSTFKSHKRVKHVPCMLVGGLIYDGEWLHG